jgi:hypothetical protein
MLHYCRSNKTTREKDTKRTTAFRDSDNENCAVVVQVHEYYQKWLTLIMKYN